MTNSKFKTSSQKGKKGKKRYPRNYNKDIQRNNLQDAFADKEFDKGEHKAYAMMAKHESNDAQWYFKQSTVLKDVASFAYGKPLGTLFDLSNMFPNNDQASFSTSIPGLMACDLVLTPGIATDAMSPINIAAQNVYTYVRKTNSGGANYDPPDLMLYLYAMDSVYSCWNWLKRIYGEASIYNQVNKYKPRAYAEAERVDLDDVYANLADFRAYLNMAANRISSFCVPAVFNLMVRHSWLFSNIYKDADTTKAQEYMFTPALFYQYDETSSPKGGVLAAVNIGFTPTADTSKYTVAQLENILDDMINALQYSQDVGIMSGDILKAYGEGNLFKLSQIDPDYKVESVYNKEVLTQFENAIYWGYPEMLTNANLAQFVVKQDPNTNFIKFQPVLAYAGELVSLQSVNGSYLNFHWDSPTPEDVIVASRFNIRFKANDTTKTATITDCGSEIMIRCKVFSFGESVNMKVPYAGGALTIQRTDVGSLAFDVSGSTTPRRTPGGIAKIISITQAFDWCPQIFMSITPTSGSRYMEIIPLRDWDVYTYVSNDNYEALNQLALLSEFNVPN